MLHGSGLCVAICIFQDLRGGCFSAPSTTLSVPRAWHGRTFAADLYQKTQALSRLQVQLLAHQDADGFP